MKKIKVVLIITFFCICNITIFAQKADIYRLSEEQKIFEFSQIYKELYYNFANMEDCPEINIDSLYLSYIPKVAKSINDFEYFGNIEQFLRKFNNGHVFCVIPNYILNQLVHPLLYTKTENEKVFIENIGTHYSKDVRIGDEILKINGLTASDYFEKYGQITHAFEADNKVLKLVVKTEAGIKKFNVPYDIYYYPQAKDTAEMNKKKLLVNQTNDNSLPNSFYSNRFLTDSINDFAYIKLTQCNLDSHNFFVNHYDSICKLKNLIVDVSYNEGGSSPIVITELLLNQDTIYYYPEETKINNSVMKARANVKVHYYEPEQVSQDFKDKYYSYYYNEHFEIDTYTGKYFLNQIQDSLRYKGNVYILASANTPSAGEDFVLMMSQGKNVKIFGEKTAGGFGQPLVLFLQSGMQVFINTTKTYDYKNNNVSTGFQPEYDYDFSEIYKMPNTQEMLSKIIDVIKTFENQK
ncbi:MAG: hypothetical protein LBV69_02760 [Bacteroidales bacterium]|jgi:C-terminal processing protease CtpA/Prc|nr:hypothetical protein [Bacteroidales bacterium]